MWVCVCVCVCTCVSGVYVLCVRTRAYVCVHICDSYVCFVRAHTCVRLCVHICDSYVCFACARTRVYVCVCAHLYVLCVCTHVYMPVCVSPCACTRVTAVGDNSQAQQSGRRPESGSSWVCSAGDQEGGAAPYTLSRELEVGSPPGGPSGLTPSWRPAQARAQGSRNLWLQRACGDPGGRRQGPVGHLVIRVWAGDALAPVLLAASSSGSPGVLVCFQCCLFLSDKKLANT